MGWGGVWAKFCQGFPPMGQRGGHGFPSLRHKGCTRWFQLQKIGNNQSRVCPQRGVERVAGEGIENAVKMQDDRLSDHRHAQIDLCHSEISDLCPCLGDNSSWVFPPAGGESGWRRDQKFCWNAGRLPIGPQICADYSPSLRRLRPLLSPRWWSVPGLPPHGCRRYVERGFRMLLKRDPITADGRHVRTVLCCSDASDLCPLPGALSSCQIIQASHPHNCHEWARQGWW